MDTIENKAFENETVTLTGKNWRNCTFLRCTLILECAPEPNYVTDNTFDGCWFAGDGWPAMPDAPGDADAVYKLDNAGLHRVN